MKPVIKRTNKFHSGWPGAMTFIVKLSECDTAFIKVTSWRKLANYIAAMIADRKYPRSIIDY